MPFNANTYRYNKYRKKAYAYLRDAKAIRDRAVDGTAYAWEIERISTLVKLARISMHLALGLKRIAARSPKKAVRPWKER